MARLLIEAKAKLNLQSEVCAFAIYVEVKAAEVN